MGITIWLIRIPQHQNRSLLVLEICTLKSQTKLGELRVATLSSKYHLKELTKPNPAATLSHDMALNWLMSNWEKATVAPVGRKATCILIQHSNDFR